MFFVRTISFLRREPLAIGGRGWGGANSDALDKYASEPAHGSSKEQAANPPMEAVDVTMGGMVPPDATPLVSDLGPSAPGGGDEVVVEAFVATPRPRAGAEGGAYLLPLSAVVETAKDKAMTVVTASLPGPRHAVLESTTPFSGPMPVKLDESGCFPLAVLRGNS